MRLCLGAFILLSAFFALGAKGFSAAAPATPDARLVIAQALLQEDSEAQAKLVSGLAGSGDRRAVKLLKLWKEGGIYFYTAPGSDRIPVTLDEQTDDQGKQKAYRVADGSAIPGPDGKPLLFAIADLEAAETDSNLRSAMKQVIDAEAFSDPDPVLRLRVVREVSLEQDPAKLPILEARMKLESNSEIKRALLEGIALAHLKSDDVATRVAGCAELGNLCSIPSQDALKALASEATRAGDGKLADAANAALLEIASHVRTVNIVGTLFRGLSLGSILLVVAIGLAITFGVMGVINMAHGELLVVGAYTTYLVQCVFGGGLALSPFGISMTIPGLKTSGALFNSYFLIALPCSFLAAALVGIVLERTIIRFLYKRPLESLLATWGVSLVLQQLFRLIFGANNVQVDSPSWLSGNWTVNDVLFGWNRVFVIGFAILIIILTWAVLNKTSLGLLIRSVMQNREMAACMGVRTERVNMLTFGFGSGLAGLAGAFLSQVGNVGPSLGQSYVVDSFMTVVVGGVGNLIGTVISALGIGVVDQSLQQILLNPVLGKILVLIGIILFLQWRPQGLFVTKSRSLES